MSPFNKTHKKIIIVENEHFYNELFSKMLNNIGISFSYANENNFVSKFRREQPDIILIDTNMIHLVGPQNVLNLEVPVILTTDDDLSEHFQLFVDYNIVQVLKKPFKYRALKNILEKLMFPDPALWFGLQNYIKNINQMKRIKVFNPLQIRPTVASAKNYFQEWGYKSNLGLKQNLIWQEILSNAVYHAHDYGDEKLSGSYVKLAESQEVITRFGTNGTQYGFSVRDFQGTLSSELILKSINKAIVEKKKIDDALKNGEAIDFDMSISGRGFDLIRSVPGEYYIVIDPGVSTEILVIYDGISYEKDDSYGTIKILELPKKAHLKKVS